MLIRYLINRNYESEIADAKRIRMARLLFVAVFVADIAIFVLGMRSDATPLVRWLFPATGIAMFASTILAYRSKESGLSLRIGSTILSLCYVLFIYGIFADLGSGSCPHPW
jgi:hypothetical protein